ncbi:hypothetical protein CUMW_211300 [Citrus unshiu]|uniref:Uncharacterized protein n=1 Tax=Citrus unshiu TaxID=55188 RepID=A0A2H5QAE2_CITUN|nr:hypothetical protein CUMW_211300 [Citrus unshiu]
MGMEESVLKLKLPLTKLFNLESGDGCVQPRPVHIRRHHLSTPARPSLSPHRCSQFCFWVGAVTFSEQQDALLAQVKRMLRLTEADERNVRGFKRIVHQVAQKEGEECQYMKDF